MKLIKNKILLTIITLLVLVVIVFGVNQIFVVDKAHRTFENYYTFRGCTQLINRTEDSGQCKTSSGQIIKIVKFKNQWYLDGDLPFCWNNICL